MKPMSTDASSHRSTWFTPDRPVEGTVNVLPGPDPDLAEAEEWLRAGARLGGRRSAMILAEYDRRGTEVERLHRWSGLMSLLDEHYPPDVIDGSSDDPGPRIVALTREVGELRGLLGSLLKRPDGKDDVAKLLGFRKQRAAVLAAAARWEREVRLRQVELDDVGMAYLAGMVVLVREALGVESRG